MRTPIACPGGSQARAKRQKRLPAVIGALVLAALVLVSVAPAGSVPPGFQDSVVFSGLTQPTNIAFAPDGRVFVAEKSGLIKVFDSLQDTTPTIYADLRTNVYNFWD